MSEESKQAKNQEASILALNKAIDAVNIAWKISNMSPATALFASVVALLTMIRNSIDGKETDQVALRSLFSDISKAFGQATSGINVDEISQFTRDTVARLKETAEGIQIKLGNWDAVSQLLSAKDQEKIRPKL